MGKKLDYRESRDMALEIIDTFKKNNLSLNQITQILDLVEEILVDRPLWTNR